MIGTLLQEQQRIQSNQHKLLQMEIQNLTYSFNKSTILLSNLQTRQETTVAFTAGVGPGDNKVFSPGQTVIFRQIIYQVGGGYNPSSGIFTAPKTGLYVIFCTNVAEYHETFWTKIMINGSAKAGVMALLRSSNVYIYQSASNLVVHLLQMGDRVWIQVRSGNHLCSDSPETTFSVVMINGSF
ncbi:EMILIN-2-like [Saccostrea cucullata]|uniref:EMILIN-2-like n=1 Tax=Saccostrea cuccullata TaxID=36930 RepID=UPI002ECFAEB2